MLESVELDECYAFSILIVLCFITQFHQVETRLTNTNRLRCYLQAGYCVENSVQPFQATEGWNNIFAELLSCQEKVLIYRTGQEYLALKKNHYCHEKSALSARILAWLVGTTKQFGNSTSSICPSFPK